MNKNFLKRNYKVSKSKRREQIKKMRKAEEHCENNKLENTHIYDTNGYCKYCYKVKVVN